MPEQAERPTSGEVRILKDDPEPREGYLQICKRCNIGAATGQIRADPVCEKCFLQYVTTKTLKRMETYRPRAATEKKPKKLLLPTSFGPSSISLLAILDGHLKAQLDRMGRTTYTLLVVHINIEVDVSQNSIVSGKLEKLKIRFPSHEYLSANITQALVLEIDWKKLGLEGYRDGILPGLESDRLNAIYNHLSSTTSKADITSTLLTRLLVDIAKKNDCDSILFGDSTTRLAERTLTETAKGRGFSLPWQVSDGISPYGINFLYPLRDLLKKELLAFSSLKSPPLIDLIIYEAPSTQISVSAKSTTIDDLMAQYFKSVEENYPSIVANVVRTSSKLKVPAVAESSASCGLCGLPVAEGTDGINGWGGDQSYDVRPISNEHLDEAVLCYGCSRSING